MEQELKRKTTVIGHRNPDTDSICSAICYANLKRAITGDAYIPARAGHVNGETRFVLDYFGMEEPKLVEHPHRHRSQLSKHQRRACAARNARARERKTKATKHTKASFLQGLAFLLGRFFR